jgi:hypothetical protein
MSRVEDDLRVNTLKVLTSASIPGIGGTFSPTTFGLSLVNQTLPVVHQTVTATGSNQTIYTVPAARRAFVTTYFLSNNSGLSAAINTVITVGGATITFAPLPASLANGAVTVLGGSNNPLPVLEAGDTFAVNTTQQPIGVYLSVLEFDTTSNLKSIKKTSSWIIGDNTIYTVPIGKTAAVLTGGLSGTNGYAGFGYVNISGSTVTSKFNVVPSGGSPSVNNLIRGALGSATGGSSSLNPGSIITMAAGDFFSINVNSATDTQLGYVTVMEI